MQDRKSETLTGKFKHNEKRDAEEILSKTPKISLARKNKRDKATLKRKMKWTENGILKTVTKCNAKSDLRGGLQMLDQTCREKIKEPTMRGHKSNNKWYL